jgi:hypothetical protein
MYGELLLYYDVPRSVRALYVYGHAATPGPLLEGSGSQYKVRPGRIRALVVASRRRGHTPCVWVVCPACDTVVIRGRIARGHSDHRPCVHGTLAVPGGRRPSVSEPFGGLRCARRVCAFEMPKPALVPAASSRVPVGRISKVAQMASVKSPAQTFHS